jgi:Skp family chaperone for outer membrane proteins
LFEIHIFAIKIIPGKSGMLHVKSRKHAAAMQSKLDTTFAKYHNDVQEMQAKSNDLVRKNKSLRNKNKGTPLSC